MDHLKGKEILIGKEPGQGRLLVSAGGKTAAIGSPGSVPGSVSRCKVSEGVAHAKITVNQNGDMVLTNMKPENVTYVNGSEIVSKRILPSSTIELGKDRFRINLAVVIEAAKKLVNPGTDNQGGVGQTIFNIKHLERVWNDYQEELRRIQEEQRKRQLYARLPMFFTMGGGAISFVLSFMLGDNYKGEIQILSGVLVVVGVILLAYSFMKSKKDTALEDRERATEKFQDDYVCPNPDCNKFLGNISYKLLKKQYRSIKDQKIHCPHCGCEYIEK